MPIAAVTGCPQIGDGVASVRGVRAPVRERARRNGPNFRAQTQCRARVHDTHENETDDKLYLREGLIPRQMLGSVRPDALDHLWGKPRSQSTKVVLKDGMREGCDPDSNGFIGRQFGTANPEANNAGNNVIDRRRAVVQMIAGIGEMKPSRRSADGIVPRIFSTDEICARSGADFGAFRPLISESADGYRISFDEEVKCKMIIPYH